MIELALALALIGLGCSMAVRGPIATAWWRHQATIADARTKALEAELAAAQMCVAAGRDVYLRRLEVCGDCPTCRPEPMNFDLAHHEFGAPE